MLAVKPGDVAAAAAAAGARGATRVLSIAAGVSTATHRGRRSAPACAVVRAMPNTPALVGAGAAAIAAGTRTPATTTSPGPSGILAAVGTVVRVPEHLLDAVTGLSGSGPAYVFLVAEALTEAGVARRAATRRTAERSSPSSSSGSADAAGRVGGASGRAAATVTSPGGTTAAGLRALERAGVRAAFLECAWRRRHASAAASSAPQRRPAASDLRSS